MIFALIVLFSALSISGTGAYFSILGLATMFPGSTGSVIVMGSVLEVGKIVAAVWLHLNWKRTNFLMKGYLTAAVIILMLITSMGIFGFLSKAHIEHTFLTDKEAAQSEQIDSKIARERELIARQEGYIEQALGSIESTTDTSREDIALEESRIKAIDQRLKEDIALEQKIIEGLNNRRKELDMAVTEIESQQGGLFSSKKDKLKQLKESQEAERLDIISKINAAETRVQEHRDKADIAITKSLEKINFLQQNRGTGKIDVGKDIEKYNNEIGLSLDRISDLEAQKAKFQAAMQELEAEVGPVKYIAKLFEDFAAKQVELDSAVRLIIIVLIFVFDPVAVLLVLAATTSLERHFQKRKQSKDQIKNEKTLLKITKQQREELDNIELKIKKLSKISAMPELPDDIKKEIESLTKANLEISQRLSRELASLGARHTKDISNLLSDHQGLVSRIDNIGVKIDEFNESKEKDIAELHKGLMGNSEDLFDCVDELKKEIDLIKEGNEDGSQFKDMSQRLLEKANEMESKVRTLQKMNKYLTEKVEANSAKLSNKINATEKKLSDQFKLTNDELAFLVESCEDIINKENKILAVQDEIVKGELSNGIKKIESKLATDSRDSEEKTKQKERLKEIVSKLRSKIEDF